MADAAYRFDQKAGRYRVAATGRFLPEQTIRDAVDRVADLASERMAALSQRLLDGTLSLADWERAMQAETRAAVLSGAIAAQGGRAQMSAASYGRAGRALRDQYEFIRSFAKEISDGQQALDGRLVARSRQYGHQVRVAFERERSRGQQQRGMRFAHNVLHASQSCAQCTALTARGWLPIAEMPPVGSRSCRGSCKCTLSFRADAAEDAA